MEVGLLTKLTIQSVNPLDSFILTQVLEATVQITTQLKCLRLPCTALPMDHGPVYTFGLAPSSTQMSHVIAFIGPDTPTLFADFEGGARSA